MHMHPGRQQEARRMVLGDALRRAGVEAPEIRLHDTSLTEGYRAKVRLAVRAGRGGVRAGMRAARSHDIVAVDTCLLLLPALDEARRAIPAWLAGSDGRGEASVMPGAGSRPVIHLTWQGQLAPAVFAGAQERINRNEWAGASIQLQGAREPAVLGDPRGWIRGADSMPLVFPPGGFMQAHAEMNRLLACHVREVADPDGRPTLELFAGAGNLSVCLAEDTDALETVEQDARAVEAARDNLDRRSRSAKVRAGDAEQASVRSKIRVAVLDPPRTGAPGASLALAHAKVRRVIMVSCDPATFARDAATLNREGRFRLERLDVFDMFPHTSHVETVAVFRRGS